MNRLFDSKRNILITSIVLNIVIFLVLIMLGDVRYETNDDFSMSNQIADGWYYVSFVNFYVCKFIGFLDNVFTGINWFILLQVMISFITLVVITYIFFDLKKVRLLNLLFIVVLCFISIDQYLTIQFTKTSALMLICGFIMMFHGIAITKSKALTIFGFLWMFFGSTFRFSNTRAAICFALAFLGAYSLWYVINKSWDRQEIKNAAIAAGKILILLAVISGLALSASHISKAKNIETQGLKDFREYSKYRAKVLDYPLPQYEDSIEMYQKIGFKNHDRMMLKDKYLDYDQIASLDNLKYLAYMQADERKTLSYSEAFVHFAHFVYNSITGLKRTFFHLLLLVFATVMGFLMFKKRWLVYPLLIGAACFAAYIYLFHFGRTVYRAVYIIELSGMLFLFYSFRFARLKEKYLSNGFAGGIIHKKTACIILALLLCVPFIYTFCAERHWDDPKEDSSVFYSDKLYDYITSNKNKTFVINSDTSTGSFQKAFKYYKNPYLLQPKMGNYMNFGGWSTMSPYKLKQIKNNGLNNLYSDIIDNDRVIVINNSCKIDTDGKMIILPYIENYFNDRYGEKGSRVKFVHKGSVGGFNLWQVKRIKEKENEA